MAPAEPATCSFLQLHKNADTGCTDVPSAFHTIQFFTIKQQSSFFVKKQFRIFTIFFIGAYQNKIHICKDAKASFTTKFGF